MLFWIALYVFGAVSGALATVVLLLIIAGGKTYGNDIDHPYRGHDRGADCAGAAAGPAPGGDAVKAPAPASGCGLLIIGGLILLIVLVVVLATLPGGWL